MSDRDNPWTTLDTRAVYENPWISVREDRVIRPDGSPGIYGVVHFRNRAIGVLPVEDDGSVWLVGQYRYPHEWYSWELPEGGAAEGESAEDAARRELREETGLIADRLEPFGGEVHLSNSATDERGWLYRASGLTKGPNSPEGTERLMVRRVPWDEATAMLDRGEITDSLSVIALLREAVRRSSIPATTSRLSLVPGRLAICRMDASSPVPVWASRGAIVSITRTGDELSIVCDSNAVPEEVPAGRDYVALKVAGPMELSTVGVLAAITGPLARAGISLFAVSTFETDYILVKLADLENAKIALEFAGHSVSV